MFAGGVTWVALAVRVGTLTAPTVAGWLAAGLGLVFGWALADLVSGLFHYWADELASEHTPWLGRNLIVPFREHHHDPLAMTQHGVGETNGDNALGALLVMVAILALGPAGPGSALQAALAAGVLGFSGAVLLTNQIHKWAHVRHAPRAVRFLQRHRVLLAPVHHAQHHRAHDRAYCITSGWFNPFLDRILPRRPHLAETRRQPRSIP